MNEGEKRGIGERGPDKEKRDFNPKSLSNLKQFQKPVSNVSPSVNPAINSSINWSKLGKVVLIGFVISFIIWKIHQRKKQSDETSKTEPSQKS